MPEQRSALSQYRELEQKRLTHGLSPDEQARLARLRELVAAGGGAPAMKPGFDVNAAAAALRESLLPAGLRHRPPPTPAPTAAEAAPVVDFAEAEALASAYGDAQPVAAEEGAPAADGLFDPASFGTEPPPYDPNGLPYDPNVAYADPNAAAAAGYDASGQPAWDPDQPWDPNAAGEGQPYDPNAAYPADPNAAYPADPNAQPYDPNVAYADPNAPAPAGYDASGQPAWDPNQPWDPNAAAEAQPYDPNAAYLADPNAAAAAGYDASGQPAWDPNQPWEPNAAGEGQPYDPNAAYPADPNAAYPADPSAAYPADAAYQAEPGAQPFDPSAVDAAAAGYAASGEPAWAPDQPWDPSAAPEAPPYDPNAADLTAAFAADGADAPDVQAWDPSAAPAEGGSFAPGDAQPAAGWDAEPPPPEPPTRIEFGEYDAAGGEPPLVDAALLDDPPPEAEYAATSGAGAPPAAPELGEYDETAGFAAAPFEANAAPADAVGLESARPPPELETSWQPETVLDAGFAAESGGSFGADADAAAPEWAQPPATPPWQETPALDLGLPGAADDGPDGYELSPAVPSGGSGTHAAAGELFGAPEGDLAVAEEAAAPAEAGAGPELDFSHADLSAPDDAPLPGVELAALAGAELPELPELPPEEPAADLPPLDLAAEELPVADLPAAPQLADLPEILDDTAIAEVVDEAASPAVEADLSFDVAEEPPAAELPEPPVPDALPAAAALEAAPVAEDEIPTIDGADILEEIIEDVPSAPPQSLDFEPIVPAAPPAPGPIAIAPPPPAPAAVLAPPMPAAPAPVAAAADPAPAAAAVAPAPIPGSHRVVVHTVEGIVRRGVLEDPDLAAAALALAPQPGAPTEDVPTDKVKAIFFMLAPGEKAPAPEGKRVRVTFRDGRQIAGLSPDYREDGHGFFMIPADTRTNTGRIWVFRAAVRAVSVG